MQQRRHTGEAERTREPGLCTAADTRPTGALVLHVQQVPQAPVGCLHPCTEQQVFGCTTNTLIKWDGRTPPRWLTRSVEGLGLTPAQARLNSCPRVQTHTHFGSINNTSFSYLVQAAADESVRVGDVTAASANLFKINKERRALLISLMVTIVKHGHVKHV